MASSFIVNTLDASISSYSRTDIIAAIHEFYTAIIKLPYIDTDALVLPPEEGWPGVREDELRKRGKTDGVIELLRHLSYLRNPDWKGKWMLSPDTLEIAYCDGEVYSELMDKLQPTPPHCIWLTKHDSRDGVDVLLDTHTGTITEWSMIAGQLMIPMVITSNLPMRTGGWITQLILLGTFSDSGKPVPTSDDDFKPDSGDDDDDDEETDSNFEIEGGDDEDNAALSEREVIDILQEAVGDEAQNKRTELISGSSWNSVAPIHAPRTPSPDLRQESHKRCEEQANIIYEIFQRNGWPATFDRERCKLELEEFRRTISFA
ncbi:hypothetical protein F4781DRAFT_428164 [Annulohypoxylon bovei var. microspora]|nr:hypothetical protein F4781DRAFT_428164 [Annulohypoxylon bovei var. microspora]